MKRWLIGLALIIIMGLGCGAHSPRPYHYIRAGGYSTVPLKEYKVWIDKNFGEADKLSIDDAIKQWNYALNGYVIIKPVSYTFDMEPDVLKRSMAGEGWVIMKITASNPMVSALDKPAKPGEKQFYTLAWVNEIGGNRMWIIRDRLAPAWVSGVTMHEIGHLLGADHDSVYLMAPHYNWEDYRCVDYAALKRVARYQHLPMERLNYCEYGLVNLPVGNKD